MRYLQFIVMVIIIIQALSKFIDLYAHLANGDVLTIQSIFTPPSPKICGSNLFLQ